MEEKRILESFELRVHVTFDKPLSVKDLIEILSLVNKSYGQVMKSYGTKCKNKYDYFKIDKIESGSIDFWTFFNFLASAASILGFLFTLKNMMESKKAEKTIKIESGSSHFDREVYIRNQTNINLNVSDNFSGTLNIHINNLDDRDTPIVYLNDDDKYNKEKD